MHTHTYTIDMMKSSHCAANAGSALGGGANAKHCMRAAYNAAAEDADEDDDDEDVDEEEEDGCREARALSMVDTTVAVAAPSEWPHTTCACVGVCGIRGRRKKDVCEKTESKNARGKYLQKTDFRNFPGQKSRRKNIGKKS